jgi:hypothetical protein
VQKIRRYGRFTPPTRLIIYYGKAVTYNTLYLGVDIREFADVAAHAAEVVRGSNGVEKIYLLQASSPDSRPTRSTPRASGASEGTEMFRLAYPVTSPGPRPADGEHRGQLL